MSDEIFTELQKLESPIKYYDKLFGPPEFTEFIKEYERKAKLGMGGAGVVPIGRGLGFKRGK